MSRRLAFLLALVATVATLSACGDDDEGTIPPENADALEAELAQIEEAQAQGQCENAEAAAQRFLDRVNELPAPVDDEVKVALRGGAENLVQLTQDPEQCVPTGATGPEETTTEPPPTITETTTTEEALPPPADEGEGEGDEGNGPSGDGPPGQDGGGNGSGGTGGGEGD